MKKLILISFIAVAIGCSKSSDPSAVKPDIRSSFIGDWSWNAQVKYPVSSNFAYTEQLSIAKGLLDSLSVHIGDNIVLSGKVTDSVINVLPQTVDGASISGTIELTSDGELIVDLTSIKSLTILLTGSAVKGLADSSGSSYLFSGNWKGTGTACGTTINNPSVTISGTSIQLNFYLGGVPTLVGTASPNHIDIPNQNYGTNVSYKGAANFTGSPLTDSQELTLTYDQTSFNPFSSPPTTTVCTFSLKLNRY